MAKFRITFKRQVLYDEEVETLVEAGTLEEATEKYEKEEFLKWLITGRKLLEAEARDFEYKEVKDFEVDYDTR